MVIAIWTIALLSLLVISFALDALLESKINLYVRERRRVDYMTQSGVAIAEMLILDYKNASSSSSSEEDEDDMWLKYKLDLQRGATTVTDYPIEEDAPEKGTVSIEISSAEAKHWPINMLVSSDSADQIWENILNVIGLPMEYQEEIVDSWYDWRDEDSTTTGRNGAENDYYEDLDPSYRARNGEIHSVDELKMIRGIRDRLAIFNGGPLDPEAKEEEDPVNIRYGLKAFFDLYGESVKININSASKEVLMTVPGIDGDEEIAQAIIEERTTGANMSTALTGDSYESPLFKDWNDLNSRLPVSLMTGSESYFSYAPEKYFKIRITGKSAGITHTIIAVAVVQNDEVRYVRWREDP